MIHCLRAIWAFPERFIGSIGRGCVRMFVLTWHHVLLSDPEVSLPTKGSHGTC